MSNSARLKFILLFCWSIGLDILLLMPMPTGGETGPTYVDKLVHFLLFGGFAFLLALFLRELRRGCRLERAVMISFFIATAYASIMEIIQSYVPSRSKSIYDFLFGFLGAIIFLSIYYYANRKSKK